LKMKIIAFIIVYNEEEIIGKCIKNAREQGLDIIVIDNGCTDRTIKIAKSLGIPIFEHKTEKYRVHEIFRWAISKAKSIGCDWYTVKDADEIFETYDGRKVVEVVNEADGLGYNCMRFDMYEFWPTVDDDLSIKDFTKRIQYYSYLSSRRVTMIKNDPLIHMDIFTFPEGTAKESPNRLIFRHYKFISLEQGRKKVKDRLNRIHDIKLSDTKQERTRKVNKQVSKQYLEFTDESKFYVLEKDMYQRLNKFDGTWIKEKVFDGWRGY